MAKTKPKSRPESDRPLLSQVKLNPTLLWVVVAVIVVVFGYVVTKIYAASASMTLTPSTTSVNIGSTVTVAIRENSGTDTVNAVQANVTYDSTKLQYVSVDDTGTAFAIAASTTPGTGTLQIARAVSGGSAPVSGDQLITTVTFKAIAAGSVPLTLTTGSAVVRSTDNTDILAVKNNATLTLADTAAPTVPTGLAASAVAMTSLTLTWSVSSDNVGVSSYRVYRNGAQVGTTAASSFSDSGLAPATAYQYRVAAVDAAGNVSAQSAVYSATTLADTVPPSAPGTPSSPSQTMTSINLIWSVSSDNVGVSGYRVYRNGAQITTTAANTFVDSGLVPNTTYTYAVVAYDAAGNTSLSSAAAGIKTLADTQPPAAPTGLSGSANGLNVALSWNASTDNVSVASYIVYVDGAQQGTTTSTAYTVTGAPLGAHAYSVAAKDAAGNVSQPSTALSVTIYQIGDGNHDGKVNIFDLSAMLAAWGASGANTYDLNGDGVVNIFDLSILLSKWTG